MNAIYTLDRLRTVVKELGAVRVSTELLEQLLEPTKPTWTSEWPSVAGKYWFYGKSSQLNDDPSLLLVDVHIVNGQRTVHAAGEFLYKSESTGVFAPALLPELPRGL
jgi:hypothetical protein